MLPLPVLGPKLAARVVGEQLAGIEPVRGDRPAAEREVARTGKLFVARTAPVPEGVAPGSRGAQAAVVSAALCRERRT